MKELIDAFLPEILIAFLGVLVLLLIMVRRMKRMKVAAAGEQFGQPGFVEAMQAYLLEQRNSAKLLRTFEIVRMLPVGILRNPSHVVKAVAKDFGTSEAEATVMVRKIFQASAKVRLSLRE